MKKNIILALCIATAILSSCNKDNGTISLRANINTYQNNAKDSKTHVDDDRYVYWNNNDGVQINGNRYSVNVSESDDNTIATIANVTESHNGYCAVYPASQEGNSVSTDNGTWSTTVHLPQTQTYHAENGAQVLSAPMAAYCPANQTTSYLNFKNLCALLRVDLAEAADVACIEVTNTNAALWGDATISGPTSGNADPTLTLTTYTDVAHKTVKLDFTNSNPRVNSRGPFYVVLPGNIQLSGLTIKVYTYKSTSSSDTITRFTKSGNSDSEVSLSPNYIYTYSTGDQGTFDSEQGLGIGEFTVGEGKKVRFSTGNLQYQASTGTWRFAEHQWDFIGDNASGIDGNNASIDQNYSGWIDLFGYGTSGVAHNDNTYYPYTKTTVSNDYASITINNTNHDWGVNPIINGGNQPNKWRTLTKDEFSYLFNNRTNYNNLHKDVCKVHEVDGIIILPDNFPYSQYSNLNWGDLSDDEWNAIAARGAIFMPITGKRNGVNIEGLYDNENSTKQGYYWTSQFYSNNNSNYFYFKPSRSDRGYGTAYNYYGMAVRLVRDVN
jgi:hypothetical protein